MKRFLLKLLKLALIIGALALVLMPVAREQCRLRRMAENVEAYRRAVATLDPAGREAMLDAARAAGSAHGAPVDPFGDEAGDSADEALPDPCGNGLVCVLEIPKLGATLPVWRAGAAGEGARHVAGTGLTVSGAPAACVLAVDVANLDRLSPGDQLILRVVGERTACEVVKVAAYEAAAMAWPEDGEWCVLVARDPANAAGGRLLVTARQVSPLEVKARDDSRTVTGWSSLLAFAAPLAAVGLIALALFEGLRQWVRRARIKRMRL